MALSSSTINRLEQVLGRDAASEIHRTFASIKGSFAHTFSSSIGVNGVSYEWPTRNASGALTNDGHGLLSWTILAGVGTVTSVGLRMPAEYSVVGSPVSFSGDFVVDKVPQSANVVYAGPSSGVRSRPTFRRLVVDDLPEIPIDKVEGLRREIDATASSAALGEMGKVVESVVSTSGEKSDRAEVMEGLATKVSRGDFDERVAELWREVEKKADLGRLELLLRDVRELCDEMKEKIDGKLETKASLDGPSFGGTTTTANLAIVDGSTISMGQSRGTRVGGTRHEKLAFYGAIPVSQPAGSIITAIVNLGLVRDPSIWMDDIVGLVARLEAIERRLGEEADG